MTDKERYQRLREIMRSTARLGAAAGLCHWDMEMVNIRSAMPSAASDVRSEVMAELAAVIHERTTAPEVWDLIQELQSAAAGRLSVREAANVRKLYRQVSRERKLPLEFVRELSELEASAHHVWSEAKDQSNFTMFQPKLEQLVALKRREAKLVGDFAEPYDALIDTFEPGMTCAQLDVVFASLANSLPPLVARIAGLPGRVRPGDVRVPMSVEHQRRFVAALVAELGFETAWGRIGESAHPFSNRLHPGDVGITVDYNAADALLVVGSAVHETGHALYEAQVPQEEWGMPTGEAVSMGAHESQSRFWENIVGRSRLYINRVRRLLAAQGPAGLDLPDSETIWRGLNAVAPSLIRTEADEFTYCLHVVLRYEIERDLIGGRLEVSDVPTAWNSGMRRLLGVEVPDDAHGCLQDVHWSGGMFGYFPSYALGNLAAAQLTAKMSETVNLDATIGVGDFAQVRSWLRDNVHIQTDVDSLDELMVRATGTSLDPVHFQRYLEAKARDLFGL